ncbi:MAG: RHS repeat-associated core domain-containing protein [Candidatus Woesearchaeota archaeon]
MRSIAILAIVIAVCVVVAVIHYANLTGMVVSTPTKQITYVYTDELVLENDGTPVFLHNDYMGSVRMATDERGFSKGSASFTVFGDVLSEEVGRYGFQGNELDFSGLVHMGARDFTPGTGRFYSVDPVPREGETYSFANANPLRFSDASGMDAEEQTLEANEEEKPRTAWDSFNAQMEQNIKNRELRFAVSCIVGFCVAVAVVAAAEVAIPAGLGLAGSAILGAISGSAGSVAGEYFGAASIGEEAKNSEIIQAAVNGAMFGAVTGVGVKAVSSALTIRSGGGFANVLDDAGGSAGVGRVASTETRYVVAEVQTQRGLETVRFKVDSGTGQPLRATAERMVKDPKTGRIIGWNPLLPFQARTAVPNAMNNMYRVHPK